MKRKAFLLIGLLVSIAALVFGIWFVWQQSIPIEKQIANKIPEGALLRDTLKIDRGHLIIYIEPGYEIESEIDLMSCPGEILGQPIIGKYHLALFQRGRILSDVLIPEFSTGLIWKNKSEVVPLLKLADYTGDNKPYEFVLTTTSGGCGFYDSLVAGFDPDINQVRIYSNWISQFKPDSSGKSHDLFDCGNHGNTTKTETWYEFDQTTKFFKQTKQTFMPCSASVEFIKNYIVKSIDDTQIFTQENITWSKDRKIIAATYITKERNPSGHLILFEDVGSKIIKNIDLGHRVAFPPVVSPDGQYIAVQADLIQKITVYDFSGNYITDLATKDSIVPLLDYKWSSDSKKILYRFQGTDRYYEVTL